MWHSDIARVLGIYVYREKRLALELLSKDTLKERKSRELIIVREISQLTAIFFPARIYFLTCDIYVLQLLFFLKDIFSFTFPKS